MLNLYDLFCQTARRQPDAPALLGPGPQDALSYRTLQEAIDTAADKLRQELRDRGVLIEDTREGTRWRRK